MRAQLLALILAYLWDGLAAGLLLTGGVTPLGWSVRLASFHTGLFAAGYFLPSLALGENSIISIALASASMLFLLQIGTAVWPKLLASSAAGLASFFGSVDALFAAPIFRGHVDVQIQDVAGVTALISVGLVVGLTSYATGTGWMWMRRFGGIRFRNVIEAVGDVMPITVAGVLVAIVATEKFGGTGLAWSVLAVAIGWGLVLRSGFFSRVFTILRILASTLALMGLATAAAAQTLDVSVPQQEVQVVKVNFKDQPIKVQYVETKNGRWDTARGLADGVLLNLPLRSWMIYEYPTVKLAILGGTGIFKGLRWLVGKGGPPKQKGPPPVVEALVVVTVGENSFDLPRGATLKIESDREFVISYQNRTLRVQDAAAASTVAEAPTAPVPNRPPTFREISARVLKAFDDNSETAAAPKNSP